ncbi:aspartate dehydrogenase [Tersicoccus solisilvae]|uniref:L-aspartate dehydrogenase n=1 Tax=Tersicoccus solisilvae TaxID=1882339 RepID=A0ABQ1P4T3_9MICC|nr:aspartate dehydrogenase domain-containing protein [Tersicoccus solisilvae]GGC90982.1 aspartate dehydrogenase [Tersicoccus solisilvae]
MTDPHRDRPLRVALLGHGAIGSVLAERLTAGAVEGAELVAVITRSGGRGGATAAGVPVVGLDTGIAAADVVVECASVAAARELGPAVIAAGRTLLLASIGALNEPDAARRLTTGPGRLLLTTGAIGGLDVLTAHRQAGGLRDVAITSTKRATSLLQPWMDPAQRDALATAAAPVVAFEGTAADVIDLFPRSANVAVAVGLAVGDPGAVTVRMVADPDATRTTHRISAVSDAGRFHCTVENDPNPDNPASSALVPYAMLAALASLARPSGRFA